MRVLTIITIRQIVRSKKPALNLKTLGLVFALLRGVKLPPIKVQHIGEGKYDLKDGRHRLTAHQLLGQKTILAYVGVPQHPDPFKPLVHGPNKRLLPRTFDDIHSMEPKTWLQL